MKVPLDEICILVGLDGLTQSTQALAPMVEELVTAATAEAILRALQAERWEEELKLYRLLN